jgi:DNA-binding transcriptional ArsR family regulator
LVHQPSQSDAAHTGGSDPLDPVWKALANTDRRRILDLLRDAERRGEGGIPTGEIVLTLGELSRYAVMQHLRVLERANLVVTHRRGRLVLNHLNAVPIRQIYERWVSEFEGAWAGTLTDLKRRIEGDGIGDGAAAKPRERANDERVGGMAAVARAFREVGEASERAAAEDSN